jgi:hypothetical protein
MVSDEAQKELEAAFLRSWDGMEGYFDGMILYSGWGHMKYMLTLIRLLRERGYDRQLRAGQSMASFILSRSLEHGLREGQPRLIFGVSRQGEVIATLLAANVNVTLRIDRVEITPELENLLIPLLAYPID